MTRGRLIWTFLAEVFPIDTAATAAASRYDYRLREPVKLEDGTEGRVEGAPLQIPCQVETEGDAFESLRMMGSGDSPTSALKLVFHFQDLEDRGLIDSNGVAAIRKGDRLARILDDFGILVQAFVDVPLYCTEVQARSFGLSSKRRNLLLATFTRRETSTLDVT